MRQKPRHYKPKNPIEKLTRDLIDSVCEPMEKSGSWTHSTTEGMLMEQMFDMMHADTYWIIIYSNTMQKILPIIQKIEDTYFTPRTEKNRMFIMTTMNGISGDALFYFPKRMVPKDMLERFGKHVTTWKNFIFPVNPDPHTAKIFEYMWKGLKTVSQARGIKI